MTKAVVTSCLATAWIALAPAPARAEPSEAEQNCQPTSSRSCAAGRCGDDLIAMLQFQARDDAAPPAPGTCDPAAPFDTLDAPTRAACVVDLWADAHACQKIVAVTLPEYRAELTPALIREGEALSETARQRAVESNGCDDPNTLCLDRDGEPLGKSTIESIAEGETLTVHVLSPLISDKGKITVTLRGVRNLDSLAKDRAATAAETQASSRIDEVEWFVVASEASDAAEESTRAIEVVVETIAGERKKRRIAVEHGRYFVEFGIEVPFVYRGTREVTAPNVVSESTEPRAAISAIIFPRGRPKGRIGYEPRDNWGLQIGTDFDFTKGLTDKDYHVGIAYEPIAGFGIGVGVSLVKGEFVPDGGTLPPLAMGELEHDSRYLLRPYVSVFLTTEFVDAARATITSLQAEDDGD